MSKLLIRNTRFALTLIFACVSFNYTAAQGIATSGNWDNPSTWLFNGVSRLPGCGDTILIPSGVTVTVITHEDYTACSVPMSIIVQGVLQFTNGYKLDLPCFSSVIVSLGGVIKKATPGSGNSTYIQICGCSAWNAGNGTVNGPSVLACSVLPISLLLFNAEMVKDKAEIRWITASEVNNDYFTLERSADGENFEQIGNIAGNGNSTVMHEYFFEDQEPFSNISYYRLKQTDYDGKFSYSDVIVVKNKSRGVLKVITCLPDENRTINLKFHDSKKSVLTLRIFDLSGTAIFQTGFHSTAGINNVKFTLPFISSGCYLLRLSKDETVASEKICF